MKRISRILPALLLCTALAACGNSDTSSTTSDTTIIGSPMSNTADNTGAGIGGRTTSTGAADSGNMSTGSAQNRSSSSGQNPNSGSAQDVSATPANTNNRTNGRNNQEAARNSHLPQQDSVNPRMGLAPSK